MMSSEGNRGTKRWEGLEGPTVPEATELDTDAMMYVASEGVQGLSPGITQ